MASVFKRGGKTSKGSWIASWTDHTGKRITLSTRTTDKAAALRIAHKHEADAALRRDGVIDAAMDSTAKESQRSIESHLADFESKLKAADRSGQYIAETMRYIRAMTDAGGFRTVANINADAVNKYSNKLKDEGRSARTIQANITAIKGFTKWLLTHHKIHRDPLAAVKKPNPKTDRRHERRMLLPDEWKWLEAVTIAGPDRHNTTGAERVLLYATAITTGLRSGELRTLTRGRLFLDHNPPFITCKAGSTKNKKEARLYIYRDLADKLADLIATKSPKAPVFSLPHESNMADMLRDDLADAREQWIVAAKKNPQAYAQRQEGDFLDATNHDGQILDFHALRHTCGAWLAMNGEHPKAIQQIMRHSSITLTMDTYGHLFPGQEAEAIGRMQPMLAKNEIKGEKATGTADAYPARTDKSAANAQQIGRETTQTGAAGRDEETPAAKKSKSPKPLQIASLGDEMRPDATGSESAPFWNRTKNLLIKSWYSSYHLFEMFNISPVSDRFDSLQKSCCYRFW